MKQTQNRKGIILGRDHVTTIALTHVQELVYGHVILAAQRTLADQNVRQHACDQSCRTSTYLSTADVDERTV